MLPLPSGGLFLFLSSSSSALWQRRRREEGNSITKQDGAACPPLPSSLSTPSLLLDPTFFFRPILVIPLVSLLVLLLWKSAVFLFIVFFLRFFASKLDWLLPYGTTYDFKIPPSSPELGSANTGRFPRELELDLFFFFF